ncbi:MAG: TIGR02253 family HAD-type hydrolase [Candidatus Hydrothermae bacterium]|nr:TIGR02253 family HAD-type hydrolase [Candidatus Hydrothermae bacterium]
MIKAVVFDLDNTLVDFMKMKEMAVEGAVEAMIDAGLPLRKEDAIKKIYEIYDREGIEDQKVFDKFLSETFGRIDYKILAAGIVGYRKAKEAALVLYPHVHYTLMELLKMGKRLAVISDAPKLQAWTRLAQTGLHHYFEVVVTFDDTGKRKPDPEPFIFALDKLNVRPEESIMIGDWAERDIIGAKTIGMVTVFARYGNTFDTRISGADYEVDDIQELLTIIKELDSREG